MLGAIILDSSCISEVVDILKPANFYFQLELNVDYYDDQGLPRPFIGLKYSQLYEVILEMYPSLNIDVATLTHFVSKRYRIVQNNLLSYSIARLTDRVASTAHIQFHSLLLVEDSVQRRLNDWITSKVQLAQQSATLASAGVVPVSSMGNSLPEEVQKEMDFAEIRKRLNMIPNVFDKVRALRLFFSSYGYTEELEEVEELAGNINSRTAAIRAKRFEQRQYTFIKDKARLCGRPEEATLLIETAIAMINGSLSPSPKLINHIHQIPAIK